MTQNEGYRGINDQSDVYDTLDSCLAELGAISLGSTNHDKNNIVGAIEMAQSILKDRRVAKATDFATLNCLDQSLYNLVASTVVGARRYALTVRVGQIAGAVRELQRPT